MIELVAIITLGVLALTGMVVPICLMRQMAATNRDLAHAILAGHDQFNAAARYGGLHVQSEEVATVRDMRLQDLENLAPNGVPEGMPI